MLGARKVIFRATSADAIVPVRQTSGAAGYDIHAITSGVVPPRETVKIRTGFSLRVPFNVFGIVLGRSGLAIKFGLEVKASYVKNGEEVIVHICNHGEVPFHYERSMRIAQLIFAKIDTDVEYVTD
ncbi:dUTP pyrophosphatase [Pancytospora epiphaga]|nr:dUTP pyrophosphatase [Pancytospora epiphaga]